MEPSNQELWSIISETAETDVNTYKKGPKLIPILEPSYLNWLLFTSHIWLALWMDKRELKERERKSNTEALVVHVQTRKGDTMACDFVKCFAAFAYDNGAYL